MPQITRPFRNEGLTLIEMVLVMVLSLVIFMLIALAYVVAVRTLTQETIRSDIFWEGTRGLEAVTEEIRESLEITEAQSNSISFWWSDLNDNGTMESNEVVNYSITNQILVRTQGSETKPMAHNVSGFNLDYDNPVDPSLVTVTLTMQKEGNLATLESRASLRNK